MLFRTKLEVFANADSAYHNQLNVDGKVLRGATEVDGFSQQLRRSFPFQTMHELSVDLIKNEHRVVVITCFYSIYRSLAALVALFSP